MTKNLIGVVLVAFNLQILILAQVTNENCENARGCAECIQTPGCAWCSKVKQESSSSGQWMSGCYQSIKVSDVCDEAHVENPKSRFRILASRPMRNDKNGNTIQIRPQEVAVKLKPGDEIAIDVEFLKAENYPVDLYYLMDFSSSMSKYKNNLSRLGNKLAETMKNLTSDFQLGFGTFVDKVTLPFTSTLPSHLLHPCPKCRSPYSYRNHMSLSKRTDRFPVEVERAEMSGNIDTPEGVLDGLMQAIVCQRKLNWREKARHIIVVSTDAPFHLAGDGKLGGVVEPNDELCHLDDGGYYTHSLVYDYPSVSQINYQSLENNMNIIFAVVNKVKHEYHGLMQEIRGASLGLLDAGENIADLIKAQYEKITTTIRLTENSQGTVSVGFSARCSHDEKWKHVDECTDVRGGSLIHFKVHLSVSDCSVPEWHNQDIQIKPEGINETLTVHLQILCDCECSKVREMSSSRCSHSGDFVCGQCECHEGKLGEKCECTGGDDSVLQVTDTSNCLTNNQTGELCSGRGDCKCGVCRCHRRKNPKEEITGKHCECDNFSCERLNGVLCSGHGTCKCGKCTCDHGWSDGKCDCPTTDAECKAEDDETICSGKGSCVCGMCYCNNGTETDEHRYSGKYCQNCMTCLEECELYNECIECLAHDSGSLTEENCSNCSNKFNLIFVDSIEELQNTTLRKTCVTADHKGCTFRYVYGVDDENPDKMSVWAEKDTWCPKQVNLIAVVAGTIGGTVLIGLLSLVAWKVLTDLHDRREYEKFERERHLACWGRGENPLFKTATTSYENPTCVLDSTQVRDSNPTSSVTVQDKECNSS